MRTHTQSFFVMRAFIYFIVMTEVVTSCGFNIVSACANNRKTVLIKNTTGDIFLRRSKRYLVFEKGATVTLQGNIAKSIIPPAPRGLNMITEYTISYDLPWDLNVYERIGTKARKSNARSNSTTSTTSSSLYQHDDLIVPYNPVYFYHTHPEDLTQGHQRAHRRRNRCTRGKFYDTNRQYPTVCLKRAKRYESEILSKLTVSQRIFYDLIEKWSLLHGFLPRYCFMRTLCESAEFLLPYGRSLLHDIIHIFLRYTKPWTVHHKTFGRSLRRWNSIDECAKLYGLYCRASWLHFIANVVHGSRADC